MEKDSFLPNITYLTNNKYDNLVSNFCYMPVTNTTQNITLQYSHPHHVPSTNF